MVGIASGAGGAESATEPATATGSTGGAHDAESQAERASSEEAVVVAKGDRDGVAGGASGADSGNRNPQLVQNFAPMRMVDPQFGHRSMDASPDGSCSRHLKEPRR